MEDKVIHLVLRLLARYFPAGDKMPTTEEISDDEVLKWNLVTLPLFLVFAAATGFLLWGFSMELYHFYRSFYQPDLFVGLADDIFGIPAIFGGIFLSLPPLTFTLKLIMKDRYELYFWAASREFDGGYNPYKVLRAFSVFFAIILALVYNSFFLIGFSLYQNEMSLCGPVSCSHAKYSEVTEIGQFTHFKTLIGDVKETRNIYIRLKNGDLWVTRLLREDPVQDEILARVSQKTGLLVRHVDMEPKN